MDGRATGGQREGDGRDWQPICEIASEEAEDEEPAVNEAVAE